MPRRTIASLEKTIGELKLEIARLKAVDRGRRNEINAVHVKLNKIQAVLNGD